MAQESVELPGARADFYVDDSDLLLAAKDLDHCIANPQIIVSECKSSKTRLHVVWWGEWIATEPFKAAWASFAEKTAALFRKLADLKYIDMDAKEDRREARASLMFPRDVPATTKQFIVATPNVLHPWNSAQSRGWCICTFGMNLCKPPPPA